MRRQRYWFAGGLALALLLAGCRAVSPPPDTVIASSSEAEEDSVVVRIDTGDVGGVAANGVEAFLGIPYAAPPVGELRWRAPQPVTPWSGVRRAAAYGNDCSQAPNDIEKIQTTPGEDCLYLNESWS